jgi:hypothetical protein
VKTCSKCRADLPLDHFGKHIKNKDGRQDWCRPCQAEYGRQRREQLAARPTVRTPATKRCPRCETLKPSDKFHRHKSTSDGLQPYCAECSIASRREWQQRHAEAIAAKQTEKLLRGAASDQPKTCTRCGTTKPPQGFYLHRGTRDGRSTYCIDCQKAATRKWNAENREKIAKRNAAVRAAQNPNWRRDQRHIWLRRYGLDPAGYDALLQKQGGICAICQLPERVIDARTGEPRRLSVDHCHSTGRVRGLLCGRCNRSIGQFADDHERLLRAAAYLQGAAE